MRTPKTQVQTVLGPSATTVRAARRLVRHVLRRFDVTDGIIGAVEVLTSEVVTNALQHGGGPRELSVRVEPCTVRVEVSDRSSVLPSRRQPVADSLSGRGLTIVEALASAWGADYRVEGGKRVWFEVDLCADGARGL